MEQENFAVPEKLKQYVMMVPSKLRLVTLAAFILEKCKVRLFAFILLSSPLPYFPSPFICYSVKDSMDYIWGFEVHLVYREPQES